MPKRGANLADELVASMEEAAAIVRGKKAPARVHHAPEEVDVRAIRRRLGLSQTGFAMRYGLSPAAVRDWEQHRRRPEPAARILLKVIEKEPEAVERALAQEPRLRVTVSAAR
jgi:putative transcriptional regulator